MFQNKVVSLQSNLRSLIESEFDIIRKYFDHIRLRQVGVVFLYPALTRQIRETYETINRLIGVKNPKFTPEKI